MSNIWLCSDWHFNHNRAFIYSARGFNSIEEMNEAIITHHNELVAPDDLVYCLGDCGLGGGSAEALDSLKSLIERLNGSIIIIRGNHDSDNRVQMYKTCHNVIGAGDYATMINYKGYHFYCSHYPTLTGNLEKESLKQMTLCLYGHTHQKTNFLNDMPFAFHCGLDSHDCRPVNLDNIIEEMQAKVEECKAQL